MKQYKTIQDLIRLNKYVANSGVCSRREADELIKSGKISVNGKNITELGTKVKLKDAVKYNGKLLNPEKSVYVLLNKPKDHITTTDDPQGRNTVMNLVRRATDKRIYPVGRLDRNTTGLLLLTNDGDLAKKLTHPSHKVKKIYDVELNKPLPEELLGKIENGLVLEDGKAMVDAVSYIENNHKNIGLELHIGKNRIVRRIFEHLGYEVVRLDRSVYAGLTKIGIPRGKWRYLNDKEVGLLKSKGDVSF